MKEIIIEHKLNGDEIITVDGVETGYVPPELQEEGQQVTVKRTIPYSGANKKYNFIIGSQGK